MELLALTMGFEQILDAPAAGLGGAVPQTIAFYAGCVAYQNRWLDTLLELKTDRRATYQLWVCAALVSAVFGALYAAWGVRIWNLMDFRALPLADKALVLPGIIFSFLPTVVLSVAVLDLLGRFANFTSPATRFFSKAAFGVYLLHPMVWPLISMLVIKVFESIGHSFTYYCGEEEHYYARDYTLLPTWLLFLGWFCTEMLSQLILWPLIHLLRRIPGCASFV